MHGTSIGMYIKDGGKILWVGNFDHVVLYKNTHGAALRIALIARIPSHEVLERAGGAENTARVRFHDRQLQLSVL